MHFLLKLCFAILSLAGSLATLLLLNFVLVYLFGAYYIKDDLKAMNHCHHLLVLGAGNSPLGDWQNPTFVNRLKTAILLEKELDIKRIICSGKKVPPLYNEAKDMSNYLVQNGMDSSQIFLDEQSKNTIESIKHYALHYPGDSVIIISQHLHLQRSLVIAHVYGLHAFGYSAGEFREEAKTKLLFREFLSRAKMWWELIHN